MARSQNGKGATPPLMTQAAAARQLGVPRSYIQRWVAKGMLEATTDVVAGRVLITRASVEAVAKRRDSAA